MALIFLFLSIFLSFPILHVNIKNLCQSFSEIVEARILKLCIHICNELYCGIENQTYCSYSSLYLSIFLSFKAKFVPQFSHELYKLESSNMVYICKMCDCIVGLRLRLIANIHPFLSAFLFF